MLITLLALYLSSCKKFDERLERQDRESGIISVMRDGVATDGAKIDETVTVYAKIGDPKAEVRLFIGDVPAEITSRGPSTTFVVDDVSGAQRPVPMDTFNIIVPRTARLGANTLYFTLNGAVKPALSFAVRRPDILVPLKTFVEPWLITYMDSVTSSDGYISYILPDELRDGSPGEAVVNKVMKLTYDKDAQIFYFLDQRDSDLSYRIRKMQNGVVTTIAGGGDNYFAVQGIQLRLGTITDLRPGPDGWLYFAQRFMLEAAPVSGLPAFYSLVQRIDPTTGKVETVLGGNRLVDSSPSRTSDSYVGLEDGPKDAATISYISSILFSSSGDLYFLDGPGEYSATLLRRLTTDGVVETVLGKVDRFEYSFEDIDGKTYTIKFYTELYEHSDGFGDEVRIYGASNLVLAGNGKLYMLSAGAGWQQNVVEVNLDTKEAATIIGMPEGKYSELRTGSFREVDLGVVTSFDVDFDGNILLGRNSVYKMDLQQETVALLCGGGPNDRQSMKLKLPGDKAAFGVLNRIVFDQFGNLYTGIESACCSADVKMKKVTIQP